MAKASEPYVRYFTAASVCLPKSIRMAELYAELHEREFMREFAIARKVIRERKIASAERICWELMF